MVCGWLLVWVYLVWVCYALGLGVWLLRLVPCCLCVLTYVSCLYMCVGFIRGFVNFGIDLF